MNFTRSTSKRKLEAIKQVLIKKPMTIRNVAAAIFASEIGLYQYFVMLHSTKQVHICGYEFAVKKKKNGKSPVYAWGEGEDVPKPPPKTPLQCFREKMARINQDQEAKDRYLAKRRATRKKPKVDEITKALFLKAKPENE